LREELTLSAAAAAADTIDKIVFADHFFHSVESPESRTNCINIAVNLLLNR
jgi:hypothetical protein